MLEAESDNSTSSLSPMSVASPVAAVPSQPISQDSSSASGVQPADKQLSTQSAQELSVSVDSSGSKRSEVQPLVRADTDGSLVPMLDPELATFVEVASEDVHEVQTDSKAKFYPIVVMETEPPVPQSSNNSNDVPAPDGAMEEFFGQVKKQLEMRRTTSDDLFARSLSAPNLIFTSKQGPITLKPGVNTIELTAIAPSR
jgi:hypothetical protein